MKKLILIIIVLALVGVGAGAYYMSRPAKEPDVRTAPVTRGDIVDVVAATGTLEAVTTVQVGTQVGGIVQELYADFNSIVKKGQVIARLDPTLLQTNIEQQRANVTRSEADLDRLKVALDDAQQKLDRAKALFDKSLLPRTDLDTALVNVQSAKAQIKSSEAALVQAKSQLNTAEVNMAHTVITAPIDGIVISRAVEPGQTVNAGMSAPTLFVLAADLTKMQVNANIDEADVGRMRPGQIVTFRVDAFPTETFTGRGGAGPAPADDGAERRHVSDRHQRAQRAAEAEARHDGEREHRDQPQDQRAPHSGGGDALPSDCRRVRRAPSGSSARGAWRIRRAQCRRTRRRRTQRRTWSTWRTRRRQPGRRRHRTAGRSQCGTGSDSPGQCGCAAATARRVGRNEGRRRPLPQGTAATGTRARRRTGRRRPGGQAAVGGGGRGFDPNMTPEERRKRMEERMAAMTPEERAAFQERMAARQNGQGGQGGGFGGPGGGPVQGTGRARHRRQGQAAANQARRAPARPRVASPASRRCGRRDDDRLAVRAAADGRDARTRVALYQQAAEARVAAPGHFGRHQYRGSRRERAAGRHGSGHQRRPADFNDNAGRCDRAAGRAR